MQSEAAVRQGIMNYLNGRSGLAVSSMQIDVSSVTFRQNEADALVSFRPKGDTTSAPMQIRYTLERKGDAWVVKGKGSGADAHTAMPGAGMGQMPGMQMPPAGAAGAMPPGHPSSGAAAPAPATPKK